MNASVKTIFYIIAHADDWQLFMNPDAFSDMNTAGNKVVFIVTTAGDAGTSECFWRAREAGMKESIKFCLSPFSTIVSECRLKEINGVRFNVELFNNVSCYFLRLPDGGLDGNGFLSNDYQSLFKLRMGQVSGLISLDQSIIVKNWEHFSKILESVITEESNGSSEIHLKYLNPKNAANPDDHPDHRATGDALLLGNYSGFCQSLFAGYGNLCQEMLEPNDIFWKTGIFAAYDRSVFEACGYSTIGENPELYQKWCTSRPVVEEIDGSPFINGKSLTI